MINKVKIQKEEKANRPKVRFIYQFAFPTLAEANLVDKIRSKLNDYVSLVALYESHVVGHILFTPVTITENKNNYKWCGLAPMVVEPSLRYKNVRELTNGKGVDVTLDIAGAATIANSMQSIKPHGLVCTVGFISGPEITLHITNHLNLNFGRVHGIATGSRESFRKLVQAVETNDIKPQIDSVFEMDDVAEAYKYLESGTHFGKIVVGL